MCQPPRCHLRLLKRYHLRLLRSIFPAMPSHVLRLNPLPDDSEWRFTVPPDALALPRSPKPGVVYGKGISFTAEKITVQIEQLSSNRIIRSDDPSKFIRASFGTLRFPDSSIRVTSEYISRLMKSGLFLNGKQYRFYHHSNSQLVRMNLHDAFVISLRLREKGLASLERRITTQSLTIAFISLVILERL